LQKNFVENRIEIGLIFYHAINIAELIIHSSSRQYPVDLRKMI